MILQGGPQSRSRLDTVCGITFVTTRRTKSVCKLDVVRRMPGAGLKPPIIVKAPLVQPAFQPYWVKPAVRNFRGYQV